MTHIPANANPTGHRVSVYADPACPWTWVTSQWLREVAPHRKLDLRWRSLSLWLRDTDQPAAGVPAGIRAQAAAARAQSHRLLRVFEALRAASREHDIDRLYRLWGERAFPPSRPPAPPGPHLISEIVTAADLPAEWAATADDPAWDAAIAASMNAAAAACGPSPASPTIVLGESGAGFAGPIFSSSLVGPAALRAWDAVSALLTEPGFIELRRPRTSPVPLLAAAEWAQPRRKSGPDGRVSRDRNLHGADDRGRTGSGHGSGACSETPAGASSKGAANQRPGPKV